MPALFTSPRFVALSATNQLLPGAKLTFSVSGTSTLQNVYQDEALTVPHSNPVTADGAGVFPKIYLDPSLPNYRVLLTDSALVTQPGYPLDDIPSNQNAGQNYRLTSASPELIFEETDASANNKKWRVRANTERFTISLLNDAESIETIAIDIARSGASLGILSLYNSTLFNNDERVAYGARAITGSSQSLNNTTTLQDWIATAIQLKSGNSYRIKAFFSFYGGVGIDGFKWKIRSDVSATSQFFYSGIVNGSAVSGRTDHSTTVSHAAISTSSLTPDVISLDGYIRPSALATITLQYAQNSAQLANTSLGAGSLLEFARLT